VVSIPKPDSFSGGKDAGDVEDFLFAVVNYLQGNQVPKSLWSAHATTLLTGKALSAWTSRATQAARTGQLTTWEMLVDTLLLCFGRRDKAMHARRSLHAVKQHGTVMSYVQYFQSLVSQCAEPPLEADLIDFFFRGLKDTIKMHCRFDPRTGAYWASLDALTRHALLLETHSQHSAPVRLQAANTNPNSRKRQAEDHHADGAKRGGGRGGNRGGRGGGRAGAGGGRGEPRKASDPLKAAERLEKQAARMRAKAAAASAPAQNHAQDQ
jgi:uncharacterized membrane protein YgcG